MHPGFYAWWKSAHCGGGDFGEARAYGPGGHGGYGPGRRRGRGEGGEQDAEQRMAGFEHDEAGPFGVKRPLRFLAFKLELSDDQVAGLAAILSDLKTERAQVSVDQRRRIAHIADALEGATFDAAKANDAGALQVEAAERLRKAVSGALVKIHELLDAEQRKKLAYLLRTGALSI